MISTSKIKKNKFILKGFFAALLFSFVPIFAFAQDALTLSVSPTLFEMTANPTQEWPSTIRVINSNPYEITVYADVVNFAPQGESGQGKFQPVIDSEASGQTIAEWIDITSEEIVIPPEQTLEVPFTIKVPVDAPPGGHFAALLIGTKPPKKQENVSKVETSQIVTTLVFLRVTGDVIESGIVRSFRTTDWLLEKPEATFELRFENKGNVHIQPQGEIKILNMWGQERGLIPINRATMFGNVLPDSVRKYDFTWKGQWSIADIGRYKAIVSLAYGDGQRQFASSEASFWVVPWKIIGSLLLGLLLFIAFFTWAVKLYIRKMLSMAGVSSEYQIIQEPASAKKRKLVSVVTPIEAGMLDLRGRLKESDTVSERVKTVALFTKHYRYFFIAIIGLLVFLTLVFWYVQNASVSERAYEITIEGLSDDVKISSEDIAYSQLEEQNGGAATIEANLDLPKITIVNRSGINGLAASLRLFAEQKGYEVESISNDFDTSEDRTVIVYAPELADEALVISEMLGDALLSSYTGSSENDSPITIYAGKDIEDIVQ